MSPGKSRINIDRFSKACILLNVIVAAIFVFVIFWSNKGFSEIQKNTDDFIACSDAEKSFCEASRYLTEQSRMFVMTGEKTYASLYFNEADISRNRNIALDTFESHITDSTSENLFKSAMDKSNQLMKVEMLAMKMADEYYKSGIFQFSYRVSLVEIPEEYKSLSPKEKLQISRQMLTDDEYQKKAEEIIEDAEECYDLIISQTQSRQITSTIIFKDTFMKIKAGIILLVLILTIYFFILRRAVLYPLYNAIKCMKEDLPVPESGSEEIYRFIVAYNDKYKESQELVKFICHDFEEDELTGLPAGDSFRKLADVFRKGRLEHALIMIDIDDLNAVNTNYGEATGDAVLAKTASAIKKSFRLTDYVFRLSGDRFAVLLPGAGEKTAGLLRDSIEKINRDLSDVSDGLPAITVSAGVSFSSWISNEEELLYKEADSALNEASDSKAGKCIIY